ncbi:MAG: acyl-ACP--UDP-N-acetylglucosamine O-acyltransferase [Cardiobacteriaceae bacterium]|nr:acyl-ACP--UDP-N-acetylglucosamine O-acyltransferase [Cardiobacteriaceae bacterium]
MIHETAQIHETAVIAKSALIGENVQIGAYCVIGEGVSIGAETVLESHVVVGSNTKIGHHNHIYPFASLGANPQDKKFQAGDETWLEIGNHNTIREFVTFNRGTVQGGGLTKLGDHNWIMANVHLAHDCIVGNHNVFANNASLAGHVVVGDYVTFGGYALIYQFVRIGDLAMIAFSAGVKKNVPPFGLVEGYDAVMKGINAEGLKRHQYPEEEKRAIKLAHQALYHEGLLLTEARAKIEQLAKDSPAVEKISAFIAQSDKRGLIRPSS